MACGHGEAECADFKLRVVGEQGCAFVAHGGEDVFLLLFGRQLFFGGDLLPAGFERVQAACVEVVGGDVYIQRTVGGVAVVELGKAEFA